MTPSEPIARFLMCRPEHFAVTYAINPWMNPKSWARREGAHAAASHREWTALHHALVKLNAKIELVPPVAELPDLVFTANSAVVLDRKVLLSRFRYPQRQGEETHYQAAFRSLRARGLIDSVQKLPDNVVLEGAGDCVWDQTRKLFWMGYGPRSDAVSRGLVERVFAAPVIALELVDPRFYHMDTALCPLPRGEVMYFPAAFTPDGRAAIRERVTPAQRIELGIDDARRLAANAVCVGDAVVTSGCGERLRARLEERGYRVVATPLRSFLRSGGAAFCLTLRLDRVSSPVHAARDHAAAA
jgi:N-dimethylarginine dimethylaminohydrolase